MGVQLVKVGNSPNVNYHYYEVDTIAERDFIDTNKIPAGSKCLVINDKKWYLLNTQK